MPFSQDQLTSKPNPAEIFHCREKSEKGGRRMAEQLQELAASLVARGKGILAADETVPTLTRRFDALGIPSTADSRRSYREMLFTFPGATEFISGVIMHDETIRQKSAAGAPLAEVLSHQ